MVRHFFTGLKIYLCFCLIFCFVKVENNRPAWIKCHLNLPIFPVHRSHFTEQEEVAETAHHNRGSMFNGQETLHWHSLNDNTFNVCFHSSMKLKYWMVQWKYFLGFLFEVIFYFCLSLLSVCLYFLSYSYRMEDDSVQLDSTSSTSTREPHVT